MNKILFITLLISANALADISSGNAVIGATGTTDNTNNQATSIRNGGGCSETGSRSDVPMLIWLGAIVLLLGLKKKYGQHKA